MPLNVSVVIPTHNRKDKVMRLINSILQGACPRDFFEIIVVDDASTDGTFEALKKVFPKILVLRQKNEVFLARARNIGTHHTRAKYILFVDDDMVLKSDLIGHLESFLESHPDFGIVGPVVTYLGNQSRIWHAGSFFRSQNFVEHYTIFNNDLLSKVQRKGYIQCDYVPGIFMIRKSVLDMLKGFDSINFPFSYEEIDLALRAQLNGFKTACLLYAVAYHDIVEPPIKRSFKPLRVFHHGRSRTRFYLKHLKWKLAWLPTYFLGFAITQFQDNSLGVRERFLLVFSYFKGIISGITGRQPACSQPV